jgi:hypothetical protein
VPSCSSGILCLLTISHAATVAKSGCCTPGAHPHIKLVMHASWASIALTGHVGEASLAAV